MWSVRPAQTPRPSLRQGRETATETRATSGPLVPRVRRQGEVARCPGGVRQAGSGTPGAPLPEEAVTAGVVFLLIPGPNLCLPRQRQTPAARPPPSRS